VWDLPGCLPSIAAVGIPQGRVWYRLSLWVDTKRSQIKEVKEFSPGDGGFFVFMDFEKLLK